jgi:hypothetical protein
VYRLGEVPHGRASLRVERVLDIWPKLAARVRPLATSGISLAADRGQADRLGDPAKWLPAALAVDERDPPY